MKNITKMLKTLVVVSMVVLITLVFMVPSKIASAEDSTLCAFIRDSARLTGTNGDTYSAYVADANGGWGNYSYQWNAYNEDTWDKTEVSNRDYIFAKTIIPEIQLTIYDQTGTQAITDWNTTTPMQICVSGPVSIFTNRELAHYHLFVKGAVGEYKIQWYSRFTDCQTWTPVAQNIKSFLCYWNVTGKAMYKDTDAQVKVVVTDSTGNTETVILNSQLIPKIPHPINYN